MTTKVAPSVSKASPLNRLIINSHSRRVTVRLWLASLISASTFLLICIAAPSLRAAAVNRPECRTLLGSAELEEALGTPVKLRSAKDVHVQYESAPGPGIPGEAAEGTKRACDIDYDQTTGGDVAAGLIAGFAEARSHWNVFRAYRKSLQHGEGFKTLHLGRGSKAFLIRVPGPEGPAPYILFALTRDENVIRLALGHPEGVSASTTVSTEESLAKVIMPKLDQQATGKA